MLITEDTQRSVGLHDSIRGSNTDSERQRDFGQISVLLYILETKENLTISLSVKYFDSSEQNEISTKWQHKPKAIICNPRPGSPLSCTGKTSSLPHLHCSCLYGQILTTSTYFLQQKSNSNSVKFTELDDGDHVKETTQEKLYSGKFSHFLQWSETDLYLELFKFPLQ